MNKLEQAARQALEALEVSTDWDVGARGKQLQSMKAITALREALAEQAEQEPVAWMYVNKDGECEQIEYGEPFNDPSVTPLYTAPIRTKDLTDDEIDDVMWIGGLTQKNIRKFARAVIAADREKNNANNNT